MRYSRIRLVSSHDFWPGWHPGLGQVRASYEYKQPSYAITREPSDHAYHVLHVETGLACEIPVANVRGADLVTEAEES